MAKAKKKSAKEASNIFHSIMKASVKGEMKSLYTDEIIGKDGETYLLRIFDRGFDKLATVKKLTDEEVNSSEKHEFTTHANTPLDGFVNLVKIEIEKISSP